MSQFTIRGEFAGRTGPRSFTREIDAENEHVAREHILSQFGSEHGLKRTQITIQEVSAQ
jgi:large subunit ribosomal protein LX